MQAFRKRCQGPVPPLPGLPAWERELLFARGIDTGERAARFLRPSLGDMYAPEAMPGLPEALRLIREAIGRKDRILVYGDYDVDGISAVTILTETLREEGADVSFRVPDRGREGYGLNPEAVREIAAAYRLLITVDCGIANAREVRLAKELGLTVIVTDHHEVPERPEDLPPADAVLNPLLGYPFPRLCGAGVALKICQALQGMPGVEKRIEIAALATVCDIVPLADENRVIVREGLRRMAETRRPGLRALMACAGLGASVRADDLGFRLGPRLNAAGRLGDASEGIRLLMTRDPAEARALAEKLEALNRARQETEQRTLREALSAFPEQVDLRRDRAVILAGGGWNSGIIGLVAGRICEKTHHPTVVMTRQGDAFVGSCRSVPGINIWRMLNACEDLLLKYGGHEQAAGLTVPADRLPAFRERLNRVIRDSCDDRCFLPVREYDSELRLEEVTLELVDALEDLEPTGCGNPPPVFLTRGADLQEARRVGKDRSHLKLSLLDGASVRDGIAFGLGALADQPLGRVDALYRPTRNEYGGRVTAQLQVTALRPSAPETDDPPPPAAPPASQAALPPASQSASQPASQPAPQPASQADLPPASQAAPQPASKPATDPASQAFFLSCLAEMTRLAPVKPDQPGQTPDLRPEHLLKERLDLLDPSRETLGRIYRLLLREARALTGPDALAERAGIPVEEALFALTVFAQQGCLRWDRTPFRLEMVPNPPFRPLSENPLVRYITTLRDQDARRP